MNTKDIILYLLVSVIFSSGVLYWDLNRKDKLQEVRYFDLTNEKLLVLSGVGSITLLLLLFLWTGCKGFENTTLGTYFCGKGRKAGFGRTWKEFGTEQSVKARALANTAGTSMRGGATAGASYAKSKLMANLGLSGMIGLILSLCIVVCMSISQSTLDEDEKVNSKKKMYLYIATFMTSALFLGITIYLHRMAGENANAMIRAIDNAESSRKRKIQTDKDQAAATVASRLQRAFRKKKEAAAATAAATTAAANIKAAADAEAKAVIANAAKEAAEVAAAKAASRIAGEAAAAEALKIAETGAQVSASSPSAIMPMGKRRRRRARMPLKGRQPKVKNTKRS